MMTAFVMTLTTVWVPLMRAVCAMAPAIFTLVDAPSLQMAIAIAKGIKRMLWGFVVVIASQMRITMGYATM